MSTPPTWLAEMVNEATACIHAVDLLAPIGCHYRQVENVWEISIFVTRTEVVGGEKDGKRIQCRFFVDVERLRKVLTELHDTSWQPLSMGDDDDVGAHIAVEGVYHGEQVWIRILSSPPEGFGVGRYADVYSTTLHEEW